MSKKGAAFGPTAKWRRNNRHWLERKQLSEQELRRRQRIADQALPPEIRRMRDDMLGFSGEGDSNG